jgi:hypothetical protein
MAKYLIIALNGPKPGDDNEATFNRWYDETHVPELLAVDGIVAARRFKVVKSNTQWPYTALYEIETDDLNTTLAGMAKGMGPFDPSFDKENSSSIIAMELTAE